MSEGLTDLQLSEAPVDVVRETMESCLRAGRGMYFFNNFQFVFGHYRDIIDEVGIMDTKCEEIGKSRQRGHSSLLASQTPREFFAQVDSVASSFGYTPAEAREVAEEKRDQFYKEMAPKVFMKLIEMGYNYLDLMK